MNLSVPESTVILEKYQKTIKPDHVEVVVCPSFIDIYSASAVLRDSYIEVGSQDVFYEDAGAFTGEVSAHQLKGFVGYAIVGHSERRHIFGETDKMIAKKAAAAMAHGIIPVICVGETLHERLDKLTNVVVSGQVEACLSGLTAEEISKAVIAYEPVWAIGTGHVCDPKKASETMNKIRNLIKVLYGEKVSQKVRIVYGGSVNDKNAAGFLVQNNIDGFLVGGASLDPDVFARIWYEMEGKTPEKKPVAVKPKAKKKK
jgi:triosephosphate isomerase